MVLSSPWRQFVVGHRRKWESQTRVGKLFAGNLLVPSAVFLTGGSHSIFVETCHLLSLVSMSLQQFTNQHRIYIVPEAHGCSIETLATDRHPSVRVHLRDSHADIWHEYDL
ncbi:unnamed protein product [Coregonus sp. 'balchen']|nr:unnamed protein product [Coregonus sp. 'balchen']